MAMKYIFACFWEGQEGSFILWTFWHVVIGLILIKTAKSYEAPVMLMLSLVQVFLASMLLGIIVFKIRIGMNPFLLLREHPDFMNLPFVKSPTYLTKLDGRGLNPLLQNYWMTIHPPTLFLGFALTVVPFAYAFAGVWKKDYENWQKPALPWTFIGIGILGTGILMGGAWAYEALSFGGFWAWDPVENASLVPWITLVAAGHVMIITKNKKNSLFISFFLAIVSFILILYSTFLTRSGILGDSSVHAFTDLGMQKQLLLFLLLFIYASVLILLHQKIMRLIYNCASVLTLLCVFTFTIYPSYILLLWGLMSAVFIAIGYAKFFPKDKREENIYSREFWMFVGSLMLLMSAVIISLFTSTPIFNKLLNQKGAPIDVFTYNKWTLPFAIIVMLLSGFIQFLNYSKTNAKQFYKKIAIALLVSLAFGVLAAIALYSSKEHELVDAKQKSFYLSSYSPFKNLE